MENQKGGAVGSIGLSDGSQTNFPSVQSTVSGKVRFCQRRARGGWLATPLREQIEAQFLYTCTILLHTKANRRVEGIFDSPVASLLDEDEIRRLTGESGMFRPQTLCSGPDVGLPLLHSGPGSEEQ